MTRTLSAGLLLAALLAGPAAHAQAPANDDCAGAVALPVAPLGSACAVVTASNANATGSTGVASPDCAGFYVANDVWFTVTVPSSGRVQVASSQLSASVQSVGLAFYAGTCGSLAALRCVEGYTSASSGYYPSLDIANRTPGEVLYVRAFTYSRNAPRAGSFGLCASEIAPCAPPTGLAALAVHPNRATVAFKPVSGAAAYTVRYAPAGGSALLSTPDTPTDTLLVLKDLLPGTTYTAEVAADCGGYSAPITFTTSPALANDNCAGAVALAVGTLCTAPVQVTTADATATAGLPDPACGNYEGGDLWYKVTVPANGIVQVETSDVGGLKPFQTGLALYSGSCGSLTELSCDVIHGQQSLSYLRLTGRTPGEVLYLRVWTDYGPSSQAFSLCASTDDGSPLTTWTGANGTSWTDAGNWTNGVPTAATSALVPNVPSGNYPVLPAGSTSVHSLTIDRYAGFTATDGTLVVTGNLVCREPDAQFVAEDNSNWFGTIYTGGVLVRLAGAGDQQLSGLSHLYDLQVQSGGTVALTSYLEINHALTMTSGIFNTGLTSINLTKENNIEFLPVSTARLANESETSYVLGHVQMQTSVDDGVRNDFNGLGMTLLSSGNDAPGFTRLNRYTGQAQGSVGGGNSILRYYTVEPDTDTGLNLALDLHYFAHERNGLSDNDLRPYSSPLAGGGTAFGDQPTITGPWTPEASATRLAPVAPDSASTIRLTGLTHLSAWTLGGAASPLPVQLVAFTAEAQAGDALLRWTTASEKNNAYFEAEASPDGRSFAPVGRVAGHGTSAQAHSYTLRDADLARYAAPVVYYRLRQVDGDGHASYSAVRPVAVAGRALASAYPNPYAQALTVRVQPPAAGSVLLVLRDALGRELLRQTALAAGPEALDLPLAGAERLPAGLYLLTVTAAGQTTQLRVSRQ